MNTKHTTYIVFIVLIIIGYGCRSTRVKNYTYNQKYNAVQLKADFSLLQQVLEQKHPSLYWHIAKDSLQHQYENVANSIKDSLTETEFRNKVAWYLQHIQCGHTTVRFSKNYMVAAKKQTQTLFPLYLKTWKDSLVVLNNLLKNDSLLVRGTVITAINNRTVTQIIDSIFSIISTDGKANNFKSQLISTNFPFWYHLAWGLDSVYNISYINQQGSPSTCSIKPITISINKAQKQSRDSVAVQSAKSNKSTVPKVMNATYNLQVDSINKSAYMRVSNFSDHSLRKFFRKSFTTLSEYKIQHLIVDLRENGGGKLQLSNLLAKYLTTVPFKNADTVAGISRGLQYASYMPELYGFFWPMILTTKNEDGRNHFRRMETKLISPKSALQFQGKIYILQGGYTFSAATQLIAVLKNQPHVTVIGEESGGGSFGNTAIYTPTLYLPNTKLRVSIPLFRVVFKANEVKNNSGIIPDISVYPTSESIKNGIDLKIQKAMTLINSNN